MKSDAFRHAVESGDFAAGMNVFAEDVVFNSPVVYKPYEGRDALAMVLGAVVRVFEDFEYVNHLEPEGGDSAVLHFKARVGERELDGVDILRFNEAGEVSQLTVMVRPMSGMHALAEAMRAQLEAATGATSG